MVTLVILYSIVTLSLFYLPCINLIHLLVFFVYPPLSPSPFWTLSPLFAPIWDRCLVVSGKIYLIVNLNRM